MNKLIISIIIILLIYGIYLYSHELNETYSDELFKHRELGKHNDSWNQLEVGKTAIDCYNLSEKDCMNYSNCGLCLKDNKKKCIPGDVHGPLAEETCDGWAYTNYYDRFIFGEKVTTITPSWSKFYSDYEVKFPSPQVRATL